jgi:hypothetical protein
MGKEGEATLGKSFMEGLGSRGPEIASGGGSWERERKEKAP